MRTQQEAIDWALQRKGKGGWDNLCLSFVRQSFGIDYVGNWPNASRNAGTAWDRATLKHRETDPMKIPRGVPVFFELPTVADHVVLSLGNGRCLSNDFVVDGRIDEVSIAGIAAKWGPLLGWTSDLVGQRVIPDTTTEPEPQPKPTKKRRRHFFVDVSPRYQPDFDFERAKAEGIKAAVIKCTEGKGVSYDNFPGMMARARKAGLAVAVYHWLRADSPVADQMDNLAAHIGDKSLPVFFDVEAGTSNDKPQMSHVRSALAAADSRGLNVVGVYMPHWYFDSHMTGGVLPDGLILWNSAYGINAPLPPKAALLANARPGRWSSYAGRVPTFLQFGSNVRVAGDNVDCNVYRGPKASLRKWFAFPPQDKPEPEPQPQPVVAELTVGTANLGPKGSTLDPLAAFDVFGVCEAGDRGKDLERFRATHPDFAQVPDEGQPGQSSTPIFYKPAYLRLKKVEWLPIDKAPKGTRVVPVGKPKVGAGPAVLKPKWICHAHFEHVATGRTVHVLHSHMLPSWTRTEKSLGAGEFKLRRAFGAKHVAALVAAVEARKGLVFVTGDFNATPLFVGLKDLNRVTKVDNTLPTHKAPKPKRLVDQIRHRPNPAVAVVSERRIDIGSDHMAAGVVYRITA